MYQSKRTGPVTTTVRVNPLAWLFISLAIGTSGGAGVATLTPAGILVGSFFIWISIRLFYGALRQVLRAIEVYRS